jgi:hypothetical protein
VIVICDFVFRDSWLLIRRAARVIERTAIKDEEAAEKSRE